MATQPIDVDLAAATLKILAEMEQLPEEQQLDYLCGRGMDNVPAHHRQAVQVLVLEAKRLGNRLSQRGDRTWLSALLLVAALVPIVVMIEWGERIGLFAAGTVFLAALLGLVFGRRELTDGQATLTRTVSAIAAAAIAWLIPGFIDLRVSDGSLFFLRAGGGLAVFVLIYWKAPGK